MMKVEIKRDTIVRFPAGSVIDVTDEEGRRLIAFGNASEVAEKKAPVEKKKE